MDKKQYSDFSLSQSSRRTNSYNKRLNDPILKEYTESVDALKKKDDFIDNFLENNLSQIEKPNLKNENEKNEENNLIEKSISDEKNENPKGK